MSSSPRKDQEGSRKGSRGSTGRPASHESGGASARTRSSSGEGGRSQARSPRKGPRSPTKGDKPLPHLHSHQTQSSAHHKTDKPPTAEATPQKPSSKDKPSSSSSADDHSRHKVGGAEGSGQPQTQSQAHVYEKKKPATKAERRALQEAQRKAKADKLAAAGKGPPVSKPSSEAHGSSSSGAGGDGTKSGSSGAGVSIKAHSQSQGQSEEQHPQKTTQGHHNHHQRPSHLNKVGSKAKSQEQSTQRQVQLFSHLPQYEKEARHITSTLDCTTGSLPPCIVRLGLKYSEGIICGSNARCIALLAAFKMVIQDYSAPAEKELRRDLDATIRPYISFLSRCRPLSVSMGNAIKHLKLKISNIPHDMPEKEAKESLCTVIDDYLKEKIKLADDAISEYCGTVINNGDVILVHAHSSIVQRALIDAHRNGKDFRVIVVDSRPKMEGRVCLRHLVREGIKCSYVLINAVSYIMKEVSKVIVGAHGLLANGYVMSRVGTSLIALVAKSYNVPVLVCCETYKFCDKVQTDAFVLNELGDPNDLVPIRRRQGNFLSDWKSIEALNLLNLVYDVTSPDLITMVITQLGNIPCTSVPVVLRISRDMEQM